LIIVQPVLGLKAMCIASEETGKPPYNLNFKRTGMSVRQTASSQPDLPAHFTLKFQQD